MSGDAESQFALHHRYQPLGEGSLNYLRDKLEKKEEKLIFGPIYEDVGAVRSTLLTVFVLVATLAYQGVLTPPPGIWGLGNAKLTLGHRPSLPLNPCFSNDFTWVVFAVINSNCFYLSVVVLVYLLESYPMVRVFNSVLFIWALTYLCLLITLLPKPSHETSLDKSGKPSRTTYLDTAETFHLIFAIALSLVPSFVILVIVVLERQKRRALEEAKRHVRLSIEYYNLKTDARQRMRVDAEVARERERLDERIAAIQMRQAAVPPNNP